MKRFLVAMALASVLSISSLAGEIPTSGLTAPPPDETATPTAPGDIPSVGFTQEISEAALTLIQSLFGAVV